MVNNDNTGSWEELWRRWGFDPDPAAIVRLLVAIAVVNMLMMAVVQVASALSGDVTWGGAVLRFLFALALMSPIVLVVIQERRRRRNGKK